MRSADPQSLLAHARKGDRESLGAIAELYTNYLKLLARVQIDRHLQRRLSPSDLVQETFVKAWANFGQFRGQTEQELLGWKPDKRIKFYIASPPPCLSGWSDVCNLHRSQGSARLCPRAPSCRTAARIYIQHARPAQISAWSIFDQALEIRPPVVLYERMDIKAIQALA